MLLKQHLYPCGAERVGKTGRISSLPATRYRHGLDMKIGLQGAGGHADACVDERQHLHVISPPTVARSGLKEREPVREELQRMSRAMPRPDLKVSARTIGSYFHNRSRGLVALLPSEELVDVLLSLLVDVRVEVFAVDQVQVPGAHLAPTCLWREPRACVPRPEPIVELSDSSEKPFVVTTAGCGQKLQSAPSCVEQFEDLSHTLFLDLIGGLAIHAPQRDTAAHVPS